MRTCPHCNEGISDYVIKCRHCNTWLTENPPEFWTPEEKAPEPVAVLAPPPPPPEPEITIIPGGGDTLPAVMIIPEEQPARISPRLGR